MEKQHCPSMTPKETVQRWVEIFNQADADVLAQLYDENAINHQVVADPLHGREAIRHMFKTEFAQANMVY